MTELMSQGRVRPRSMFALGVAVMVFMFGAQLLIAVWMRGVSVNGVADVVDAVMTSTAENAQEWVSDYAGTVEGVSTQSAAWIERDDPTRDEITEVLLVTAAIDPQFETAVVAYPDGSWNAIRVGDDDDDFAFSSAVSRMSGDGVSQVASLYDESQHLVATEELESGVMPIEPSFWAEASVAQDTVWFVSAEQSEPGDSGVWVATPAHDADGELIAVVASEFPVDAMAEMLEGLSLGDAGAAAVLDSERNVVVSSLPADSEPVLSAGGDERPTAEALGLLTSAEAVPGDSEVLLGYDGELHVAEVGLEDAGAPWILQVRALDSELAPQILLLRTTIQIASVAQFAVLLIGAVLFFLYWRPMKQIRRTAFTDGLTGLLRRSRFLELAPEVIADAHRAGDAVAVVVLDLDNFKRVNDEAGHAAGDRSLTEAARALTDAVRSGDLVCRWGGDEFVALVRLKDDAVGLSVAERLRSECETAFRGSFPEDLGLGATAGVVVSRSGDADIRELVDIADAHLIEGKQQEKSRSYAGTR